MKAIVIAFTLKNQDFSAIEHRILDIVVKEGNNNVVLIHGFMPRKDVEYWGYNTEVVDILDTMFPFQLCMFNGYPHREEMAAVAKKMDAKVYVIGNVNEGVQEELDLYDEAGLTIHFIPLS